MLKDNCNRLSNNGLIHDESAAIYLYTMEWEGGYHRSLYSQGRCWKELF